MNFDQNPSQHAAPFSPPRSTDPTVPSHNPNDSATSLPRASTSRSPERTSRIVQPQVLKHPSLLDNIRKTWTAPVDSDVVHAPQGAQRSRDGASGSRRDTQVASIGGVAGDARFRNEETYSEDYARDEANTAAPEMPDHVLCAKWETLSGGESRRVLLIAYKSGAFAVWDCSSLDSWFELVSIRSLENALGSNLKQKYPRGIGSIVDFVVLPSNSIGLVTRRAKTSSSHLFQYSLESHRIVTAVDVFGAAHRVAVNDRFLVVSTSAPLALHVFSASQLEPTPFSPITDLVASPFDAAPVFSLGKGGRLLAYATNTAIPSSRLDRSPAKPGAGLTAHSGLFDTLAATPTQAASERLARSQGSGGLIGDAGQVGEQVARKVSEGVLSGVKAIGEVGMNYWMTKSTNGGRPVRESSTRDATLSKSAPANTITGFGRRLSAPTALSRSPQALSSSVDTAISTVAGTVIVVDLASPTAGRTNRFSQPSALRVVSHFRPYHLPVALLSFSPSSNLLLTASTPAHYFDVFEVRPMTSIGASAFLFVPSSSEANNGKVWHRYRLQRGYTSARATGASWSDDSRFVAVGTGKGTAHVYAIQPTGGHANLENHFSAHVKNPNDLPSLSVPLSTVARVRPPPPAFDEVPSRLKCFPSFTFVSKPDSFSSSFRPAGARHPDFAPHLGTTSYEPAPIQDLLAFHPATSGAQLFRLSPTQVSLTPSSSAVAAASRGDVGTLATTAVSGLTQLMKTRGGLSGIGQSFADATGAGKASNEQRKEWVASCTAKAEWQLSRADDDEDILEDLSFETRGPERRQVAGMRWSAFAEIETFSRSPKVLPRSIYESQQFNFFALPDGCATAAAEDTFRLSRACKLEMRSQVVVRSSPQDPASSSTPTAPFEPASFDQPIRTAMQTVLDQDALLAPGSPKLPAPSFPVGVAAKQGSWRDSIPIRSVGPAAIEGLDRVRQGLGRVRLSKAGELVDAARRRRSLIGSSGQAAYSSSISFDDDEAVFADRLSIEDMGSASTAFTSEGEEGRAQKDEEWGWDEPLDDADLPSSKPSPSPIVDALAEPLFDDCDFDNFELELSAPPIATPKFDQPSEPSPAALDLPASISSPTVVGTSRNLAPPVSVISAETPSLPPSEASSPGPSNPLLEVHKAQTPSSLSSSPSSVISTMSSAGGGGGGGGGKKKKKK
ncbi:hypothetical protein JCM3766R1_003265 [Sporobolomyces carnicolor]